jgi:hypothetical protein
MANFLTAASSQAIPAPGRSGNVINRAASAEPIERNCRLAALLLRHVLDEGDDGFGRGHPVRREIAVADDTFFRIHVRQNERKLLEFAQLGYNRAAVLGLREQQLCPASTAPGVLRSLIEFSRN